LFAKRRFRGYGNTVGALAKFVSRDKAHGGIKRAGLETGLTEQVAGTFRGIIAVPDCWQEMLAPDEPAQQNESQKRWESRDAVPH